MIIINTDNNSNIRYAYINIFPDQFKTDKEKEDKNWIKNTGDYFANVANAQYRKSEDTFAKNYDLMKGIIDLSHFKERKEVKDLLDTIQEEELPDYVKHYPIINPPVNTMIGELSKRPDIHKVRAYDDDSRSEELSFKTNIVQQYILQEAQNQIMQSLAMKGEDASQLEPEQLQEMTLDSVKDSIISYTSLAEKWGNHTLTALKAYFNTKEKSEDAFRDLLICSREYFHIYEDNSKLGFSTRCENPKNVWKLGLPDSKYSSGVSGESNVPYAVGTLYIKEISEIIEEFPELTKEEIDHLRTAVNNSGMVDPSPSNLFNGSKGGIESITYNNYSRLILQERMMSESQMDNNSLFKDLFGLTNSSASFGYKFAVMRSYFPSKKKVGKLTYIDEDGAEQIVLVDENYKKSPNEISIEWGWVNQWYQLTKIGNDIYFCKPFKLLPYAPIIGLVHDIKNVSEIKSLVDLMKPFQVLYNICMNQLYQLLEKEIGNVGVVNIRRVPRPKDGDPNDALDVWEMEARDRGILFDDDSPENTKGATQNQTIARNIDLTRTNEIQSRHNLATQLKSECWELVGMNRQRLGGTLATETATANQNALVQSFAQTEPYFAAHTYVLNQWYQALLDAAQYVESTNELTTMNYLTNTGESAFIQVQGSEIRNKALWVMVTSKPEDSVLYQEMRQLAQAALQNGASMYEVSQMYTTNSMREIQRVLKDSQDRLEQKQQQELELQQQQIEQQKQAMQQQLEQAQAQHDEEMQLQKYKIDVDANTKLATAQIANYFKTPDTDTNDNGIPDAMDIANHSLKLQENIRRADLEGQKLSLEYQKMQEQGKQKKADLKIQQQKVDNEKERNKILKSKPKK